MGLRAMRRLFGLWLGVFGLRVGWFCLLGREGMAGRRGGLWFEGFVSVVVRIVGCILDGVLGLVLVVGMVGIHHSTVNSVE